MRRRSPLVSKGAPAGGGWRLAWQNLGLMSTEASEERATYQVFCKGVRGADGFMTQ